DGTDTPLRANYKNIVSKAEYYVRYSEEDVQTMTYREVVNALKNTKKPLLSLCGKKYAETVPSTTNYIIELRVSDSADPNKAISTVIAGGDCPSGLKIKDAGECFEKPCTRFWFLGGDEGICMMNGNGCWCYEKPKPFGF
ncbi:MAG: hypothetical protein Q7R96_03910, partial [Nanoarchaeota archaeon]|nr:hypothetical protein [Nanoarchaeota archaeon]